jgi:D-glycero-alpha-D-manno-heptose-7-phosphate kinase
VITTRTPLRVSFVGGGTDYESFFSRTTGSVVGCTIDLNVYVTLLKLPKFAREKFRFTYRQTESVSDIDEMKHPVVREMMRNLCWDMPLNIATMADVPGNSGLGSSSAFTVGLLLGLRKLDSSKDLEPAQLAEKAVEIERTLLGEPGGWQDQYHAAFGGFRSYEFTKSSVHVGEKFMDQSQLNELSRYFTLVATGNARDSKKYAEATANVASLDDELLTLASLARELAKILASEKSMEVVASTLFSFMNEGWEIKKHFHDSIAPKEVLSAIDIGKRKGAIAAKLCGAGSSGFLLFGHPPEVQMELMSAFPNGFSFPAAFIDRGSQIVFAS